MIPFSVHWLSKVYVISSVGVDGEKPRVGLMKQLRFRSI
jgi:hypothetical protein